MKIGIDARFWQETGVGRYIRNLVSELQEIDQHNEYVLFVCDEDYQAINDRLVQKNNKRWKVVRANIRWHSIAEQVKFPQIINRENIDLMHFPYFSVPIFYRKPYIVTIHDLILHHFPSGQATTLPVFVYKAKLLGYKYIMQQVAKHAKKILTVSEATKADIIKTLHVEKERIVVAYEGIDESLKLKVKSEKLHNELTNYFLHVGNVYPHKNVDRLVDAFSLAFPEAKQAEKLIFVGKEDYFFRVLKEKVERLGLENRILFLHTVSDEELASLYKNAHAVVIPSLIEGFGLPAVEAMASRCLVLAADIPSLKEVCQNAGLYISPYDIKDIAKKLTTIAQAEKNTYDKQIELGYKLSQHYSFETMAKETLTIYESCARLR